MAIAEMSVMTVIGLDTDKNAILEGLQRTNSVQIKTSGEYDLKRNVAAGVAEEETKIMRVENALGVLYNAVSSLDKEERPSVQADGFAVSRDEFFSCEKKESELLYIVEDIEKLDAKRTEIAAASAKISAEIKAFAPYLGMSEPFGFYSDTKSAIVRLGTMPKDRAAKFIAEAEEAGICSEIVIARQSESVVAAVARLGDKKTLEELLSKAAFRACAFSGETTARAETERLEKELAALKDEDERIKKEIVEHSAFAKELKVFSDYLGFVCEKARAEEAFGVTETAFLLEAFVPTDRCASVEEAVKKISPSAFTEFRKVPRDEFAPTLNRNGKVAENFEVVTNMYSAPAYGALDPNAVMSFFFSLFMGVIMADVGYGLLMLVGGLVFASKKRRGTGIYRMAKVFAVGGAFAIAFGAVFDGFFGFQLFHKILGEGYSAFYAEHLDQIYANSSLAGINVPSILMWCLALGTAQIGVGLVLKALQSFSRGKVAEGLFGGVVWAITMFSLIGWVFCLVEDIRPIDSYFMYVTAGSAIVGILTAGVGEKGAAKITKPFASAYGIINYVSDILSYARLYGLMLSGAQIASIFTNTLAIGLLFPKGAIGIAFGVILIVVGNVFNLAINLLGAYIHDARLQYVEFYGKFYEGDGELFTPFGSSLKHGYFENR